MRSDISFAFDQQLLNDRLQTGGTTQIVFTLRHCRSTMGDLGSYSFAQSFDMAGQPVNKDDIAIACPVPPGWQPIEPDPPPGGFKDSDLLLRPKFFASANDLKALLVKNKFKAGFPLASQVMMVMEGRLRTPNKMEMVLSVKCLNEDGTIENGDPVDAFPFA